MLYILYYCFVLSNNNLPLFYLLFTIGVINYLPCYWINNIAVFNLVHFYENDYLFTTCKIFYRENTTNVNVCIYLNNSVTHVSSLFSHFKNVTYFV